MPVRRQRPRFQGPQQTPWLPEGRKARKLLCEGARQGKGCCVEGRASGSVLKFCGKKHSSTLFSRDARRMKTPAMNASYLVKDIHGLVQLISSNYFTQGYYFYTTGRIPEGKDPELIDVKLILKYQTHTARSKNHRRRKAGLACVKYLRCGRIFVLLATHGKSPVFQQENLRDARSSPLVLWGYSIGVNPETLKVTTKVHRDTMRRLEKRILERAMWSEKSWKAFFWRFPFRPYAGVRTSVFTLLRNLNQARKAFRLKPIAWRSCVRKKMKSVPAYVPTSPEVLDCLRCFPPLPLPGGKGLKMAKDRASVNTDMIHMGRS